MQRTISETGTMSFDFGSNSINQFKAQQAYKDGSGMGGGGMYFKQKKKRQDQPEEDMFEYKDDKSENEIVFDSDDIQEEIPQDNLVNKFVNWFRINKENE